MDGKGNIYKRRMICRKGGVDGVRVIRGATEICVGVAVALNYYNKRR